MANPELELQGAIVTALKANARVAALVGSRVFDTVPKDAEFPYVSIGPADASDDDAGCITGFSVFQQLDAWSRAVGFPEVKKIADAVRSALHDAPIELASNGLVFLEHRQTRIFRDPDGLTSHSAIAFEASIEREPEIPPEPDPDLVLTYATFAGGSQQIALPDYVQLVFDHVAGSGATLEDGSLRVTAAGTIVADARAEVLHNWGSDVVFGYSWDGGPVTELGRVQVNSNEPVPVWVRRELVLQEGGLLTLYISSDFEWSQFSWSDGELSFVETTSP